MDLYKGPMMNTLRRSGGEKDSYSIAEVNDTTGYKSALAVEEKERLGINTIPWPRYSPDVMPWDFSLCVDIGKRALAGAPVGKESATAFKARLRRVALRTPTPIQT